MPRRRRQGYPQAIMIGLEEKKAQLWHIFSESVKRGEKTTGEDKYNFHESIIDLLRPWIKKGVKSILITSLDEKRYSAFMNHVEKHQNWLIKGWDLNTVSIEYIKQSAMNVDQVKELVNATNFKSKVAEVSQKDIQQVLDVLERRLNDPEKIDTLLFTLKEVENVVYNNEEKPDYILISENFYKKRKRRTQRLFQIAANKNIKTRIVNKKTPAFERINQFGGLICML